MVFDIEADGLDDATKIHCLSYTENGKVRTEFDYDNMRELLMNATLLIGHNIIRYDIPTLERILDIKIKARLIDTLALSWYLEYNRRIHGLDSYGDEAGVPKPKINDWVGLTKEEYAHRCEEDVKINLYVWNKHKKHLLELYGSKPEADKLIDYLMFKMECAREQERSKWKLDKELAQKSLDTLLIQQKEKVEALKEAMPLVKKYQEKTRPAKPFKKDGTQSVNGARWFNLLRERGLPEEFLGSVKVLIREEEPNPASHVQIKDWLFSLGWEPQTFDYKRDKDTNEVRKVPQVQKDKGIICDSVLELAEKEPAIQVLNGLSIINHRITVFQGFLENEVDGWVKAEIAGFTNTLRFKHKTVVNLPGVDKPWGKEIRGCLIAPEGYELCGADMVSLEQTTKMHYMYPFDPDYVEEMAEPDFDAHLDLAKFAGVLSPEQVQAHADGTEDFSHIRKNYKAANYACTYGVREATLARQTKLKVPEAKELIDSYWKRNWAIMAVVRATKVKTVRGQKWLFNPVSGLYYWLKYDKDKFSTLNQGTGVYCFDSWVETYRKKRPQLTAQFHDETIQCLKLGFRSQCTDLLKGAIKEVNDKLQLNVILDVDVKFGAKYSDIH